MQQCVAARLEITEFLACLAPATSLITIVTIRSQIACRFGGGEEQGADFHLAMSIIVGLRIGDGDTISDVSNALQISRLQPISFTHLCARPPLAALQSVSSSAAQRTEKEYGALVGSLLAATIPNIFRALSLSSSRR